MTRRSAFGVSEDHITPLTDGLLGALFPVKLSFLDFGAGFPVQLDGKLTAQPSTRFLHRVICVGATWGAVTSELGQLGSMRRSGRISCFGVAGLSNHTCGRWCAPPNCI
jgi:hypothetical protein